jgi:hypothetical protein
MYGDPDIAVTAKCAKTMGALRSKLVLHRGWHRIDDSYNQRPFENTRQAYIDSARAGLLFAECDVWVTNDDILLLNHDSSFAKNAASIDDPRATRPILEQNWNELSTLQLSDGSTPVSLDAVLRDLASTECRLVVELKTSSAAVPLGTYLAKSPRLAKCVAWIMSFSLLTLECCMDAGARQVGCHSVWLLGNPRIPYQEEDLDEGEMSFDCGLESFSSFLIRVEKMQQFQRVSCGVYLQYNPNTTPAHFLKAKVEMSELRSDCQNAAIAPMLGIWNDAGLDAQFDCVEHAILWAGVVDAINTDMPRTFWSDAQEEVQIKAEQSANHRRSRSLSEDARTMLALMMNQMLLLSCLPAVAFSPRVAPRHNRLTGEA